MRYFVTIGTRTLEVELGPDGVVVDGEPVSTDLQHVEGTGVRSLLLDDDSHRIVARRDGTGEWDLYLRGRRLRADVVDERTRAIRQMTGAGAGGGGPDSLRAPMPGLVVKVEVEEGDAVEKGEGLVIVEAMKMENELRAEGPALVKTVHVETGEAVEENQVLIDFEAPEAGSEGGAGGEG